MSFALDTRDIKPLNSYEEAWEHFKKAKPWRDGPLNERPLEKRAKKHVTIIQMGNEIRCRLHSTDVVRYTPEGVSVYTGYASVSTDNFISALLRRAPVSVICNRRPATAWRHQPGQYYAHGTLIKGDLAIFDRQWNLTNPAPALRPVLNKAKALELRKSTKYADFIAWRTVYESMAGADAQPDYGWQTRRNPAWRPNKFGADDVLEMLRTGGNDWRELAYGNTNEDILTCVYKSNPSVVEHAEVNAFTSFSEFENYIKLDAKYSWAIR